MEHNNTVPLCALMPHGVDDSTDGVTLESLDLEEGFFRMSTTSHAVLECYQEEACRGGTEVTNYCSGGYEGPCEFPARAGNTKQ